VTCVEAAGHLAPPGRWSRQRGPAPACPQRPCGWARTDDRHRL